MKTQLQGSEVEAKDGISEAERVGQGEQLPPPPVSPHGLFRGNMRSLALWAADSLLNPLSLSQWMEEKFYHL